MQDGRIAERGTYDELMSRGGPFAEFVAQFGGKEEDLNGEQAAAEEEVIEEVPEQGKSKRPKNEPKGTALMQVEERAIGAVSGHVYHQYLQCVSFLSCLRWD